MSDTPATRLRAARTKLYASASEAARAHRWPVPTYTSHENDTRGYGRDEALKYAHAFGVEAGHLLMLAGDPLLDAGGKDGARHDPEVEADPMVARLRIRELMAAHGLTLEELSDRTAEHGERLSTSQISNMQLGKRGFSKESIEALARALGVPVVQLFEAGVGAPSAANVDGELETMADLIAGLRQVRTNESAAAVLIEALADKVAALREKLS